MKEGISKNSKLNQHRTGSFDGFTVTGFQYENQDGETGWDMRTWKIEGGPVHHYWVSGKTFFAAILHILYKRTLFEIGDPITGIDSKEQAAVFKAIAEWEKPVESSNE
jgi:hypothetical protein